ncbi:MAG: CDP-alcohol phosphatidyltransferase family protein [Nitrospiraceae bacterium]|nr:CDP-alcohol phosphatidyltransferase family protein [Nitrospiraceae bacterium]
MRVLNIPNTLTITRIVIIPLFVTAVLYSKYKYALYLFAGAALTDLLDGLSARLTNQKTELGTFLDPLADKFLLVTSFILFAVYGWIPKWLAITVISRDLVVVVGWFLLYMITHKSEVAPVFTGKLAIAMQLIVLAYILLGVNLPSLPPIPEPFLLLTAAVTAISALQYIYKGFTLTNAP